ncbi:hypothetical protein B0H17DRAFT_1141573 [Mycena rosella]|uniref:Uncharacterized protein n=1 Tax=Mycena rosella TaxID=1033263 RepID=A0AAD7GAF4_MYCRO|nr:hypothetical protein B0H17DRAFT_1141573 [Mycena rosella]
MSTASPRFTHAPETLRINRASKGGGDVQTGGALVLLMGVATAGAYVNNGDRHITWAMRVRRWWRRAGWRYAAVDSTERGFAKRRVFLIFARLVAGAVQRETVFKVNPVFESTTGARLRTPEIDSD